MKRFITVIISLLFVIAYGLSSAFPPTLRAGADDEQTYAMAAGKNAYFFTQKDISTSLFAVPYTYCVRIIRDDGDWYYVSYAEDYGAYKTLYGYCLKEDFTVLDGAPAVTYLYKTISVTYKADETSPNLPVLNELTVDAAFYGTYYAGATAYSYVLCQGSFGYISGANDDYPLNLTETEADATDAEEETSESSVSAELITALILIALAAAALVLLFFTSKKHSRLKGS